VEKASADFSCCTCLYVFLLPVYCVCLLPRVETAEAVLELGIRRRSGCGRGAPAATAAASCGATTEVRGGGDRRLRSGGRVRRHEVAVLLPLITPARLSRMKEPASVLADDLLREGIGVAVRPALARNVERSGAGAARLTVALTGVEVLARPHLLRFCVLAVSHDLVAPRLLGDAERLHADRDDGGLASMGGDLCGGARGALGSTQLSERLILPVEDDIAPADSEELALVEEEECMEEIAAAPLADCGGVREGEVRSRLKKNPLAARAGPAVAIPCRLRRAAGTGIGAIGVLKDEEGRLGHHRGDCRRRHFYLMG
jgi:hypothetical protein